MTLKFGHLANEQNVWHKAALKFAEEIKAQDGVEIVPDIPTLLSKVDAVLLTGGMASSAGVPAAVYSLNYAKQVALSRRLKTHFDKKGLSGS